MAWANWGKNKKHRLTRLYVLRRYAPRPPVVLAAQPFLFYATALRPIIVYGVDLVDSIKQGAHRVRPGWAHPTSHTNSTLDDIFL